MQDELVLATLRHIHAYGMTLPAAVAKLFGFETAIAVEMLERLVEAELVAKSALTPSQDYYHLCQGAAEYLDVDTVDDRPKTGTAKCTAYATLYFCCMLERYRPLIPPGEFRTRFTELYRPGPKINYYTDGRNLGYIRVETKENTSGDVFRVVDRCWRDIARRTQWKGGSSKPFKNLIESGRFRITLLTPFQGKVDRITKETARMNERSRLYKIRAADIKEHGTKHFTHNEAAYIEYQRWHQKNPQRRPPREAPPMDVYVIPGLMDLIYPKLPPQSDA